MTIIIYNNSNESINLEEVSRDAYVLETTNDVVMMSSVPNLGHELLIFIMSCTYLPSFNIKFVREVSFLKTTYDVIMTSSVPNLGHELLILIMSCTYLPSFNIKFVRELSFLKKNHRYF